MTLHDSSSTGRDANWAPGDCGVPWYHGVHRETGLQGGAAS